MPAIERLGVKKLYPLGGIKILLKIIKKIIEQKKTLKNFNTIEPPSEIVAKSLNKFISF